MKKILAVVLALVIMSAMSLNVFALPVNEDKDLTVGVLDDNGTPDDPTDDIVMTDSTVEVVYSVALSWEELSFNIVVEDSESVMWDAEDRVYDITNAAWEKDSATIIVTNNSNISLGVAVAFSNTTKTATKNGVTATITNSDTVLASAVGTAGGAAPSVEYTVNITSEVPASVPELNFTVDTITVSYSAS